MKRFHFIVPVFAILVVAGLTSADYIRIKVNVHPQGQGGGDNKGAMNGPGYPGTPGGVGFGGGPGGGFGMGGGGVVTGGKGFGMGGGPGPGMGGAVGFGGVGFGGPGMGGGKGVGMGGGPGMGGYMGTGPGMGGFMGTGPGFTGGPGMEGQQQLPKEDTEIQWLYVYLEVKHFRGSPIPIGQMAWVEHKWSEKGKWGAIVAPKNVLVMERFEAKPRAKEFDDEYKKALKNAKAKQLPPRSLLDFARRALRHNLHKEFHATMAELAKELDKLDANDATANEIRPIMKNYLRVQQELKNRPAGDDPAFKALRAELVAEKFNERVSDGGHYALWYSNNFNRPENEPLLKQKLARLEEHLESFYYWFALIDRDAEQPAMPKYRMPAVMTNASGYDARRVNWGVQGSTGDGFTPRRDNVLFFSSERQDRVYSSFSKNFLEPNLRDTSQFLTKNGVPTADLLSGKVWDDKKLLVHADAIRAAQTMLILQKAFEEDSERQTITYEGTRQLLVASGMFPRHVNVPEWVLSGLASYFETPEQAVYAGIGLPSWTNLISFKHFQKDSTKDKPSRLAKPDEVLYGTVTDRFFDRARAASELAQEKTDEKLEEKAREEWEFARCTAWGFTYYVINKHDLGINRFFRYGEELNKLPRDMDLNEKVLQACAAKAFGLSGPKSGGRLDMAATKAMAEAWYELMDRTTLELVRVQQFHLVQRELLTKPKPPPPPPTNPGPGGLQPPGGGGPPP